jgi:hypothetical protein
MNGPKSDERVPLQTRCLVARPIQTYLKGMENSQKADGVRETALPLLTKP